jgi:hypothetical protein
MNNSQVGELLLEQHILQPAQLEDVIREMNLTG